VKWPGKRDANLSRLAFIDKFQPDPSNPGKADLLSPNKGMVSETIGELEVLQGEIKETEAHEI